MFGNEPFSISDVVSLDEQRSKQREPLKQVAEKQYWTARANAVIDLIQRDRLASTGELCTKEQAVAWLCDYWATREGISLGHENPLLDPTEYGHEPEPGRLQRAWEWLNSEI